MSVRQKKKPFDYPPGTEVVLVVVENWRRVPKVRGPRPVRNAFWHRLVQMVEKLNFTTPIEIISDEIAEDELIIICPDGHKQALRGPAVLANRFNNDFDAGKEDPVLLFTAAKAEEIKKAVDTILLQAEVLSPRSEGILLSVEPHFLRQDDLKAGLWEILRAVLRMRLRTSRMMSRLLRISHALNHAHAPVSEEDFVELLREHGVPLVSPPVLMDEVRAIVRQGIPSEREIRARSLCAVIEERQLTSGVLRSGHQPDFARAIEHVALCVVHGTPEREILGDVQDLSWFLHIKRELEAGRTIVDNTPPQPPAPVVEQPEQNTPGSGLVTEEALPPLAVRKAKLPP